MKPEQRAHIKTILPCLDDAMFSRFDKAENVAAIVREFERRINAAWVKYVKEHLMPRPSESPGTQIEKVQFRDFGLIDTTEPQPSQTQKPSNRGAPPLPLSHSSQVLTSALASQRPTHALAQPASASAAGCLTTTTSDAGNTPAPAQPKSGSVAPAPRATAAAPTAPKPVAAPEPPTAPTPSTAVRFSIRNARQNEPYDAAIQRDPNVPGLRLLDVTLPEGAELTVDLEYWRITGTPTIAGEFNLGLRYTFADQPAHVSHTAGMPFVINADPKTLWQNNPSDRSAPFWKEDSASSVILGQHAKMIAARKRGRSHAHKGTCCDDDFHLHCDDANGWYLAVVADGAGSSKFSRRGSQVATRAVSSYLKDVFSDERGSNLVEAIEALAEGTRPDATNDDLIRLQQKTRNELFTTIGYAAHHAVRELQNEAKSRSDIISSPKELSTTLLIGLARKVGDKWFCAAYWVGDGAVAVYRHNHSVHLLGAPDSGEFSGQTHFLDATQVSQESLLRRLRFELVEDMTAFLLMTDGVSDPKFRSESAMAEIQDWDFLWDDLETGANLSSDVEGHETRLLEWLDFWAQGEYDDRTIAIIY
ncbi:PP2C family serine/threonine-protein phosphatase [Zoogloea sp. 1C4]|uniref:PP2C family serine/threonine-protein phosphatase n=1 Tax=Zoogloea sp. 1C4 TaxID=2570190 RepID=UPI0012923CEE|nr:PP2C family serine/threonine-protein phosphatase [Zoogloea sp. 1C4]